MDPGATILDALDADCWRLVLDRLDMRLVLRSERVSRGWQRVVLEYLQGIKRFDITCCNLYRIRQDYNYIKVLRRWDGYRKIGIYVPSVCCCKENTCKKYHEYFQEIVQKLGPAATHVAADCFTRANFEAVLHNCPQLEHLTIFTEEVLPIERVQNCTALKAVVFMNVPQLDDDYLSRLVQNAALEELAITGSDLISDRFLTSLRSPHLKTLKINRCNIFYFGQMHVYLRNLSELTRLEFKKLVDYSKVPELLNHTPKLEYLSLSGDRSTREDDGLVQSIGRLSCLKHLDLFDNAAASDALLAAVARGCPELRALDVGECPGVSGRAVAELCAARAPTLAEVYMFNNHNVTLEHVRAIIGCYHNIEELDPAWRSGNAHIEELVETGALRLVWTDSSKYTITYPE